MLSPLACPTNTKAVLDRFGLDTKYSYGQNFLINDDVIRKIVRTADLTHDDFVLEVGPGIGTLTYALAACAGRVVSVERDTDLLPVLDATLTRFAQRVSVVSGDALDFDEEALSAISHSDEGIASKTDGDAQSSEETPSLPNKLVANLPYEVAATLVLDYFDRFGFLQSATVMVQKEVADRMAALPGTKQYGAYTVKLSLFAKPTARFKVGPGNFFPPPRVDSMVQRLDRHAMTDASGKPIGRRELKAACLMADAAFANRRKTIANSCSTYFKGRNDSDRVVSALPGVFRLAGIDPGIRGEMLTPEQYIGLGRAALEEVPNLLG